MSLDGLKLAYRAKRLALRSLKHERCWWAAKADEYDGLSAFMEYSQNNGLDSSLYTSADKRMGDGSSVQGNTSGGEGAGDDEDAANTIDYGFFQEVVHQYSRLATEDEEHEPAARFHFYAKKTAQYQSYSRFMKQSDESLHNSLKAIKMQLDILRRHIKIKQATRDIHGRLEDLRLDYELEADTLSEDTPSDFSDHSQHEDSSSFSEEDDVYVLPKWCVIILQPLSLLTQFGTRAPFRFVSLASFLHL